MRGLEFCSRCHPVTPETAERVRQMMRVLAAPGRGENQRSALDRAAGWLGIPRGTARALLYGEAGGLSEERAQAILDREPEAIRVRMEQLRAETALLAERLRALSGVKWEGGSEASSQTGSAGSRFCCSEPCVSGSGFSIACSNCGSDWNALDGHWAWPAAWGHTS